MTSDSGGGTSPCTRGKTMREFEAELAELKQENFELKMKIYVLEEQKNALEDVKDVANVRLENQHLQRETERMQAEMAEKEELICKASEALNAAIRKNEEDMSALRAQARAEADRYRDHIARLEQEMCELKERSMTVLQKTNMFDDSTAMYAVAFNLPGSRPRTVGPQSLQSASPERVAQLEERIAELEAELRSKSCEVDDLTLKSSSLKLEADKLKTAEANLRAELEFRVQKLSDALSSLASAEKQIHDLKSRLLENDNSRQEIPADYQELQMKYNSTKGENLKLHEQVLKLHQRITELEKYNSVDVHKKIETLVKENADLHEKMRRQSSDEVGSSGPESGDRDEEKARLERELSRMREELSEARNERTKTLKTIQAFVKQNRALAKDVERLQAELDGRASQTGSPVSPGQEQPRREEPDTTEKDSDTDSLVADPEKAFLYTELEAKKKEIELLNEKLQKRTEDLQKLVNKELWSKNKEIEKLNRVCEKQVRDWTEQRAKLKAQEAEVATLRAEVDRLNAQLAKASLSDDTIHHVLDNKHADECPYRHELEKIKQKLEEESEENERLKQRCEALRDEAEKSEARRQELAGEARALVARLTELAAFLEALLPSLAGRRRTIVKAAIDSSREFSRSFGLSCLDSTAGETSCLLTTSIPPPILPDVSQVDFNSEDDLPPQHSSQVSALRHELERLVSSLKEDGDADAEEGKSTSVDTKPSLPLPQHLSASLRWSLNSTLMERREFSPATQLAQGGLLEESLFSGDHPSLIPASPPPEISFENNVNFESLEMEKQGDKMEAGCVGSESEGWSEPDRTVSLARIGLKEDTPIPLTLHHSSDESSQSPLKSAASAKKRRDSELRALQLKIKTLEMTIDSLVSDKRQQKDFSPNNTLVTDQVLGEKSLTHNLMLGLIDQREKLMLSLNQNDLIRQRLEEAISSVPSTPTKSDSEKSRTLKKDLMEEMVRIAERLEDSCKLCTQLEGKVTEVEGEKEHLLAQLAASEEKVSSLTNQLSGLKCSLKEKENEVLEKQCCLLELKNRCLLLESRLKLSEEEASRQSVLIDNLTLENNNKVRELTDRWQKEREELIGKYEKEIEELKEKLRQTEEWLAREREESQKLAESEAEAKVRLDLAEQEKGAEREGRERAEEEREVVRAELATLRLQLEADLQRISHLQSTHRESERQWRRRLAAAEASSAESEARLRRRLDQLTLASSEAVIERTRIANHRLLLHRRHAEEREELERRVSELEEAKEELEGRLGALSASLSGGGSQPASPPASPLTRQQSNPTSDYTSDHDRHNMWFPVCGRSNNNSSPDLGIESDNRMSSLEHHQLAHARHSSTAKSNGEEPEDVAERTRREERERLMMENSKLRSQLTRTREALEDTLAQLSSANQKKRQVEKAICRQLHKTHDILQKARLNLEPTASQPPAQHQL